MSPSFSFSSFFFVGIPTAGGTLKKKKNAQVREEKLDENRMKERRKKRALLY